MSAGGYHDPDARNVAPARPAAVKPVKRIAVKPASATARNAGRSSGDATASRRRRSERRNGARATAP
jgi:hypothetical protein